MTDLFGSKSGDFQVEATACFFGRGSGRVTSPA
jgi:hypothetical protein